MFVAFSVIEKVFQKQYRKIVFTTFYISILPLLDFIFLSVYGDYSIKPGFARLIYPFVTLAYIPAIIFISYGYRIEKHGEKFIVPFSFICILIVYYAIPNSFSKNVIENKFVYQDKNPVHMIVFDGVSYEVLNDKSIKHLFPNINKLFADNCYVFEEAYSPGFPTIRSIPKMLTGVKYDKFREDNSQFLIAKFSDHDYYSLPTEDSLFHIAKLYEYNNILIGASLPYCNIFGKYLTYGKSFPSYAKLSELLPLPFKTLLYIKYRHYRNVFLNSYNEYLSRIDSSPQNTFFFIHFDNPHEPFVFNSQGIANRYWEVILKGGVYKYKERYVEQLMYVDKKVGEIVKKLKDKNLYDKSLIIITSDHNNNVLSRNLTKVPLFIKPPFQKRQHIVKEKVYTTNMKKLLSTFFEAHIIDINKLL